MRASTSMQVDPALASAPRQLARTAGVQRQLRAMADRFATPLLSDPTGTSELLRRVASVFGPRRTRQGTDHVRARPYPEVAAAGSQAPRTSFAPRASISARFVPEAGQWQPSHHGQAPHGASLGAPLASPLGSPTQTLLAGIERAVGAYGAGGTTAEFLAALSRLNQTLDVLACGHLGPDEVLVLREALHRAGSLMASAGRAG